MSDATPQFHCHADSHIGLQRTLNEDCHETFALDGCAAAFVVADGMGGMRAGDAASRTAVAVIRDHLLGRVRAGDSPDGIDAALRSAFTAANEAVLAIAPPPVPGREAALAGTTGVAGILHDGILHIAHAGDSRAYLVRDGHLSALTFDHSFVAERVRAGDMTEDEARRSRFRNMVTRAIGIEATVLPDLCRTRLQPGDRILVCTDGLTTMLDDIRIAGLIMAEPDGDKAVAALIDAANAEGGSDNITVLILDESIPAPRTEPAPAPVVAATPPPPSPAPPRRPSESGRPNSDQPPARGAKPLGGRSRRGKSSEVLDLDKPRRRRSDRNGSSFVIVSLALVGVVALGAAGLLGFSEPARREAARRLAGAPAPAEPLPPPDLASLEYDPPVRVTESLLFRDQHAAWSAATGLVLVGSSGGDVLRVDPTGEVQLGEKPMAKLPLPDQDIPRRAPAHETHLALDSQGNLYVASPARRTIVKYDRLGAIRATIGPKGLTAPRALAVDDEGSVWFVDSGYLMKADARRPDAPVSVAPNP